MAAVSGRVATRDDLARHEGKAERVAGRIVPLRPTISRPDLLSEFGEGPASPAAWGTSSPGT